MEQKIAEIGSRVVNRDLFSENDDAVEQSSQECSLLEEQYSAQDYQ